MWYPEAFFLKHVQTVNKFIDEKSIDIHRIQHITNKYQALSKDSQLILAQVHLTLFKKVLLVYNIFLGMLSDD